MTSRLKDLKVYTTYPHPCSYLPNREATTLFVDPRQKIDAILYSRLSLIGFRRSGNHIYRPHCTQCNACIPTRVVAEEFRPNRSQRRNLQRNNDFSAEQYANIRDDLTFRLYEKYITTRHANGDMYPPSREQYDSFLNNSLGCTEYFGFCLKGNLKAVAVLDVLPDGISSIYTFFDPDLQKRGIGTYVIMWQIERAKKLGLKYVYLGYWIKECVKMSYKSAFRPSELYHEGQWKRAVDRES